MNDESVENIEAHFILSNIEEELEKAIRSALKEKTSQPASQGRIYLATKLCELSRLSEARGKTNSNTIVN